MIAPAARGRIVDPHCMAGVSEDVSRSPALIGPPSASALQ